MSTRTIEVRMAKPSKDDFDNVLFFFQGIEAMLEENVIIQHKDDEGVPFSGAESAMDWIEAQWKKVSYSWNRVLWGGKTAIDAACDPNSEVLEFKPEILAAMQAPLFWNEQAAWSQATFGTDAERGPTGPLKHLEKEARESHQEPDAEKRKVEIADCLFLVFDAARRAGMTFDELFNTAFAKLEVNKSRKWQKPTSDEPVEHVRNETKIQAATPGEQP